MVPPRVERPIPPRKNRWVPKMSAEARPQELIIVTGMSGAGRSTAAKCLEDLGFFVIDNLPPSLIPKVVELGVTGTSPSARMALVTDVRGGVYFDELAQALDDLTASRTPYHVLFLDATPEALVRRFEEVRRPHPLSPSERVVDAITRERQMLDELRARGRRNRYLGPERARAAARDP